MLHACPAMHVNDLVRSALVQRVAPRDQPAINRRLLGVQLRQRWARDLIRPGSRPKGAALERIDIKPVDDEDVVQRRLNRREEAYTRGLEFWLGQAVARGQQAVIC